MNRIYCAIGKIMEVTQNIEINICDICEQSEIIKEFSRHTKISSEAYAQVVSDAAYLKNKMDSMTFGERIYVVQESRSLKQDEISELRTLLEKRNYFTHEYFKCANFGINPPENQIVEEFEAIKEYLRKLKAMLTRLEIIENGQRERLNYLIQKAGL